jgi:hypothetical protein
MFACKLLLSSSEQGSVSGFLEHFNKLLVSIKRGALLTIRVTINLSRNTAIHGISVPVSIFQKRRFNKRVQFIFKNIKTAKVQVPLKYKTLLKK